MEEEEPSEISKIFLKTAKWFRPRVIAEIERLESLGQDASEDRAFLAHMDERLDWLGYTFHKTKH